MLLWNRHRRAYTNSNEGIHAHANMDRTNRHATKMCPQRYMVWRPPNIAEQPTSAVPGAGRQTLRNNHFSSSTWRPQTVRKKHFQQFPLEAAQHCGRSIFSSSSRRPPNTAEQASSAVPTGRRQTLRNKHLHQFQLEAAKHCATSGFSNCRPPSTAPQVASASAGRQTLRHNWFALMASAKSMPLAGHP